MTHLKKRADRSARRLPKSRPAFLLILVLMVVAMASFAMLNFSRSMLVSNEASQLSNGRLKARMCAESGVQALRLFLASPQLSRQDQGGTWSNTMFYAKNVLPDTDPQRRGNYTIVSPSLDEFGSFAGIRYGLANESAKLNLNTLAQLDALANSGGVAAAAGGESGGESAASGLQSQLASAATEEVATGIASAFLMALPGMTEEVADAILDWLDEDDEPRPLGAEYDYYETLQPAYSPTNGPISSIESLLLVRGVTPLMLFGYDENRNGMLDSNEMTKMNSGIQPGAAPGSMPVATDMNASPPPPLGWAPYLTLHSQEGPLASDGVERIDINGSDLQALYDELVETLGDESWASFIVAYRQSGSPGGGGVDPLTTLASLVASDSDPDGAMGAQLDAMNTLSFQSQAGNGQTKPWSSDLLGSIDLSQEGKVQFKQVLDLYDATVTIGQGDQAVTYESPFSSDPLIMADSTPMLLDFLTTIGGSATPGRINIMECPREVLLGIPGLTEEIVDEIITARNDGSESESRRFATWLAIEGYIPMEQMRAIYPLVTCGGDVFKAQVIGYLEGNAAFSRIEAIVSGAGPVPQVLFFRRLDHLGRGFDISTLGQRVDSGMPGSVGNQSGGSAMSPGMGGGMGMSY